MTGVAAHADEPRHSYPVAGLDRRFYGFVLDRLLLWTIDAVAAAAAYHFLIDRSRLWPGVAAVVAVVVLGWVATALAVGLAGVTPAGSAIGLRIVSDQTGGPIGVSRALLRGFVVGFATLPFGFGTAALAVTSIADPSGRRRGWHDLRAGSVVVDIRPDPVEVVIEEEAPSPIVNLTALRLVPASPHPPSHTPVRRSRAATKSVPPRLGPHAPSPRTATVTPRQGLGWPLVGAAPNEQRGAPATLGPVSQSPPRPSTAEVSAVLTLDAPTGVDPQETSVTAAAAAAESAAQLVSPAPSRSRVGGADHPSSADTARPRWQVGFDTGESFEVSGLTLVGRRPEARADEPAKRLVALASEDMSLSKTHAQFQVVPDGALVVMDRGSTNGSILIRAGVTKQLTGGRPQTLRVGDRVRFGDREMTVSRVDA